MDTGQPQRPDEEGRNAKYRVIVKKVGDIDAAARVAARRAGGEAEKYRALLMSLPAEVATNLDALYAEDLAGALRETGADAEKKLIPSSVLCSTHPGQPGRSFCLVCGKVVCAQCIKEGGGNPLCAEHSGKQREKLPSTFPWVRVILLLVLAGVGLYAYHVITKAREPFPFDRPYKLAVVGFMVELPSQWRLFIENFQKDTGREYVDLRNHTLPDITGWFQREYERYGGTLSQAVTLDIYGPFNLMEPPPEPPAPDQSFFDRFLQWQKFKRYFKNFNEQHNINSDDYDGVIYVQFVEGRFDEFTESWASREANIALVNVFLNRDMVEQDIMIVLHEFFHLLNAKDHYDQRGLPKVPEGLADPFQEPLYPQDYADVMAGRVAVSESEAREIIGLSELRTNVYTAHEVGWIPDEEFQGIVSGAMSAPPLD